MVTTASVLGHSFKGTRPINLNRDAPQILRLLEAVFGEQLVQEGLPPLLPGPSSGLLWRLNPAASKLGLGVVWEEEGRIVGNVTLLTTQRPSRYLVVNVAVHPDYRRQGIARQMMLAIADMVRQRGGKEIMLQVVNENTAAIELYHSLHYSVLGDMTSWELSYLRRREILPTADTPPPPLRRLRSHEWQRAYKLDAAGLPADLNWPEPLPPTIYQLTWGRRLMHFINGRSVETWVTTTPQGELTGMVSLWGEWGRPYQVTLRVAPEWRGLAERPLIAQLTHRLNRLASRNVRIDHPAVDETTNQLLREANFRTKRTLTHMRLTLAT